MLVIWLFDCLVVRLAVWDATKPLFNQTTKQPLYLSHHTATFGELLSADPLDRLAIVGEI